MSLVPYTITALERDVADADTSGKNIIVGATCSMFIQPANTAALLYDDAAGSNGSTAKVTNASGQVVVFVEAGTYIVSVNGVAGVRVDVDQLRSDLAAGTAVVNLNNDLSQAYTFETVAIMRASLIPFLPGKVLETTGYSLVGGVTPYGGAVYDVLSLSSYLAETGLSAADGVRDHPLYGSLVARLRPIAGVVSVQQCGAIPFNDTLAIANINRDSFRAAHISLKAEWDARKLAVTPLVWTTRVESGDYNLSNGYGVPKGMVSFSDSLGSARIKVLSATADANPKLPVVSLGRAIDGLVTVVAGGIFVSDPPPLVTNLYINPQNSGTAVDVSGVPGFKIGDLWLQADTAINFGDGSGDGIIGRIFIEDSTSRGLVFGDCQNLVIDEIYSFLCSNPIIVTGTPNNIDIGMVQTNYTLIAPLQINDGATPVNFKIGRLVCNQNVQYGTFVAPVRCRGNNSDIRIDRLEAYNYNGYAVINESGLGNVIRIGTAVLKQTKSKSDYNQGTTARGFNANNCKIVVDNLITDTLSQQAIGAVTGTFASSLEVNSGSIAGQVATTELITITNTSALSFVRVKDLDNKTGKNLFAPQSTVEVTYGEVKNPFPIVSEGGRSALKIPFNRASLYELTIRANTNSSGSPNYRRIAKYLVSVEVLFNSVQVWNAELTEQFNSAQLTGIVPKIVLQIDLGAVGDGSQKTLNTSDFVTVSVPSGYDSLSYQLKPLIS
jgi:hypothetical protein